MIMRPVICLILAVLMGLSGCASVVNERRKGLMRERTDIENMKADLLKLKDRVEEFATAQQDLYEQIEALRSSIGENGREFRDGLLEMDRAMKGVQTALGKIRQDIISNLSRKMAEIMRLHASHSSRVENGYEHIVQPGETLSEIAAVYHVKVNAIVKANNLKDPDSIREGQKLFIPE